VTARDTLACLAMRLVGRGEFEATVRRMRGALLRPAPSALSVSADGIGPAEVRAQPTAARR
jgi:hypothetical protein